MASQTGGDAQLQMAATQLMSSAPWQAATANSTTETLTQALVDALHDAATSVENLATVQESSSAMKTVENVATAVAGGQGLLGAAMPGMDGGGWMSGAGLLSPIIGGILSLFGSGDQSGPPPLIPFAMPSAIDVSATGGASTGGQLAGSDYSADGLPRAQTTSNVTVQVNAMDSRSFLDRSSDIASAVRQAILSSHSINDVLAEL